MKVEDIIHKEELTTEECIFVIQQYIHERTGKLIPITLPDPRVDIFHRMDFTRQLDMMMQFYNHACGYFIKKYRDENS